MEIRVNYQILKAPADVFLAVLNVPISNRRWRVNCQYNCKKTHMAVLKIRSKLEQPESFLGKPRNYMIPYCWLYIHYVPLICWKKISPIFGHNVSLTFGGFAWSVPFLPFSATYPHKSSTWVCLKMEKKAPELQSEHGNMSYMRGLRCFFFPR
jgi:hypothetical protein